MIFVKHGPLESIKDDYHQIDRTTCNKDTSLKKSSIISKNK